MRLVKASRTKTDERVRDVLVLALPTIATRCPNSDLRTIQEGPAERSNVVVTVTTEGFLDDSVHGTPRATPACVSSEATTRLGSDGDPGTAYSDRITQQVPDESGGPASPEHARSLRNAAMLTAAVGGLHAVLFLVSFWLLSSRPGANAATAEITEFYTSAESRRVLLVGLYLMPFAGIAFIWFVVALRMWVEGTARRVNILLSNIQLVSGILYVALFFAAAASTSVLAASVEFSDGDIDPVVAHQFPQFGNTLVLVFALRMAAMFVMTTSTIGRTSRVVPGWFAWSGYVVAAFLLLSASLQTWLALVFPIWLLVLSVILLLHARRIPAELMVPTRAAPMPLIIPQLQPDEQ